MLVQKSQITASRISEWIRDAAGRASFTSDGHAGDGSFMPVVHRFSFDIVESELNRARTKTFVRAVKPFRRIRRNQGAVNDSLIRAVGELCNVNREMAREIELMRGALAELRQQIRQLRWNATTGARQASAHFSDESGESLQELCE